MIVVNIDKAKSIAHQVRRAARSAEFEPLDVKATIPSEAVKAEAERKAVRERYAVIQSNIDNANDISKLKSIVSLLTQ